MLSTLINVPYTVYGIKMSIKKKHTKSFRNRYLCVSNETPVHLSGTARYVITGLDFSVFLDFGGC